MSNNREITLTSQDGESFAIDTLIVHMSTLLTAIVDDNDDAIEIPLPNVLGPQLAKIVEFCQHHANEPLPHIKRVRSFAQMQL